MEFSHPPPHSFVTTKEIKMSIGSLNLIHIYEHLEKTPTNCNIFENSLFDVNFILPEI